MMTMETIMAMTDCTRAQAIALSKALDKQDVARFVKGRYPWPSRLEGK